MDRKKQTEYDCMETLCVLYWIHLSDLEVEKAQTFLKMLNIHFQSAPLEEFPYYLKKRVEIHEVLVSVAEATEEDLVDDDFREGMFEILSGIFKELEGPKRAGDLIIDLKKSESLFVYYAGLRKFQMLHQIDIASENTVLFLSDKEFTQYYEMLLKVMEMCEVTSERFDLVVEEPTNKEEFLKVFEILGEGTFKKFNTELFNEFVRVFCHGLKYFHKILGRPKHFNKSGILNDNFECESASVYPSSFESVNESVENIDTGNTSPAKVKISNPRRKWRLKTRLIDEIRSRSPPRESEIMKPEGILWEDSASDIDTLSVSGSSSKRVKWTAQESKSLVEGVKRYGVGQWALIKADGKLKLRHKTNVQLKDRWRNLVKNDPGLKSFG